MKAVDTAERIPCGTCGHFNFRSDPVCLDCGRPIAVHADAPGTLVTAAPERAPEPEPKSASDWTAARIVMAFGTGALLLSIVLIVVPSPLAWALGHLDNAVEILFAIAAFSYFLFKPFTWQEGEGATLLTRDVGSWLTDDE